MDGSDAITDRLIGLKPYRAGTRLSPPCSACTSSVLVLCRASPPAIVTELAPEGGLLLPRYLHPWPKLHAPSLAFAPPAKVAGGEAAGTCAKLGIMIKLEARLHWLAKVKSGHLGACTITGFGKDTVVCKNPSFEVTTFDLLPRPSSRRDSRRTIALLPLNSTLSDPACETGRRRCPLLATCILTLQLVVS